MGRLRDLARSLNDDRIRANAGTTSVQRGKAYARRGAVLRLNERDRSLLATVQGNELEPYAVTIALDAAGVASASCTCAFSGAGWCKHVVAALIACRTADGASDADNAAVVSAGTGRPAVDGAMISRRVRTIMRSLSRMRPSEAYWHVGDVVRQVEAVLADAKHRVEAGCVGDALVILSAITSNYVHAWEYLDDSDGFVGGFCSELAPVWTEALLSAELTPAERRSWTKKLRTWGEELAAYGLDGCFDACVIAAAGWNESEVADKRTLAELVDARLNMLQRAGDDTSFLRVAKRHARTLRLANRLVEMQRVDEAVAAMEDAAIRPSDVLAFAVFLRERGELERALAVAAGAVHRDTSGPLAEWVRDVADALGDVELARSAARAVVSVNPSATALRRFRSIITPDAWPDERERVLAVLRTKPATADMIEAFLEEGALDDAIAAVERLAWTTFATLKRVVKAAVRARPDWAVATATREAERIVDAGQSMHYRHAVDWLRQSAEAYREAGREAEWSAYRAALVAKHRQKRSFLALFDDVR